MRTSSASTKKPPGAGLEAVQVSSAGAGTEEGCCSVGTADGVGRATNRHEEQESSGPPTDFGRSGGSPLVLGSEGTKQKGDQRRWRGLSPNLDVVGGLTFCGEMA